MADRDDDMVTSNSERFKSRPDATQHCLIELCCSILRLTCVTAMSGSIFSRRSSVIYMPDSEGLRLWCFSIDSIPRGQGCNDAYHLDEASLLPSYKSPLGTATMSARTHDAGFVGKSLSPKTRAVSRSRSKRKGTWRMSSLKKLFLRKRDACE